MSCGPRRELPKNRRELRALLRATDDAELARMIRRLTALSVNGELDSDTLWDFGQELMNEVERRKEAGCRKC